MGVDTTPEDGIGDTPYDITLVWGEVSVPQDRYPLMEMYIPPLPPENPPEAPEEPPEETEEDVETTLLGILVSVVPLFIIAWLMSNISTIGNIKLNNRGEQK